MRFWLIAAALASTAIPQVLSATTVKAGIEFWQRGEYPRAVAVWRALADKGDSDAAFNLGQAYRLGRGVDADSAAAKRWFDKAARAGHLDAQVSLGLLLFDSGDRTSAMTWLNRAAERGEPRALLVVGTALFNGDGVPRDPVKGYAYVSRASAQGLAPARKTLADMDQVMPLDDRRKGVAMAMAMASGKAKTAKVAKAPPPKPDKAVAAKEMPSKPPEPAPVAIAASGKWRVQLGAFSSRGAAQSLYGKLSAKLGGAQAFYVPVGTMTRLQAGPFATKATADSACARLKPQPCFSVAAK